MKKGDELTAQIVELNSEGKGVSKLEDGFVIFSKDTLPGDRAVLKILKKKPSYAEAGLVEIVSPSEYRIKPECSYFGICGGCKIQNLVYDKQLEFKTNVVRNALERIGGFKNLTVPEAIGSPDIFYYRNKMEFSFSDDQWFINKPEKTVTSNKFALGLHVPKFHSKIVSIDECFLQSELSNRILNFTRTFFERKGISVYSTKTQSGFLRFLIIRQSIRNDELMINLITFDYDKSLMEEYRNEMQNRFPEITTLINSVTSKKAQVATGDEEFVLSGKGFITEQLKTNTGAKYSFKISPRTFFQTNTFQAERLFECLLNTGGFKKTDKVLDLYCGAGSISIFISDAVKGVLGVELIEDAIKDARENSKLNGVTNTQFICSDIKEFLINEDKISEFNKVIFDPPRSGLHPKICEIFSGTSFEKIIYVSCNPHTQARDLQIICSKGKYVIDKIQPVDMFPHTYHVENIVSLSRIN